MDDFYNEYLGEFNDDYNSYELLWLWYYYHTEKVDLLVGRIPSRDDPDSMIPTSRDGRQVSNEHAKNLRKIMRDICGNFNMELGKYKNTFSRMKNKRLFAEYERLDLLAKFDFIHAYIQRQKEKNYTTRITQDMFDFL